MAKKLKAPLTQGMIYEISNSITADKYVGCTIQKHLSTRFGTHKNDSMDLTRCSLLYTAIRQHKFSNFSINLIKVFPCTTKAQLVAEETLIINDYVTRNIPLYNTVGVRKYNTQKNSLKKDGYISCDGLVWYCGWWVGKQRRFTKVSIASVGYYEAKWVAEDCLNLANGYVIDMEARVLEEFLNISV